MIDRTNKSVNSAIVIRLGKNQNVQAAAHKTQKDKPFYIRLLVKKICRNNQVVNCAYCEKVEKQNVQISMNKSFYVTLVKQMISRSNNSVNSANLRRLKSPSPKTYES